MDDLILEAVHAEKKRRGKESRFDELLAILTSVKKKLGSITKKEWEVVNDIFKIVEIKRTRTRYGGYKTTSKNTTTLSQKLVKVNAMVKKVEICKKLEKQFRIVTLDKTAVRHIPRGKRAYENKKSYDQRIAIYKNPELGEKLKQEEAEKRQVKKSKKSPKYKIPAKRQLPISFKPIETISIPLVWSTKIPAKPFQMITKGNHRLKAKTPEPTVEAIELLTEHKEKFDHLEVWWVPKDVLVSVIPPKQPVDPILVGAIKVPGFDIIYYELCRWEDESVEIGWWSKEGY